MEFTTVEEYIEALVGTKYVWWHDGDDISGATPFYAKNNKAVPIEIVKHEGTNCAGFLNLICRFMGLKIPGVAENIPMAGGTYIWFSYLAELGLLTPFDSAKTYPFGTIVLRNYVDPEDQGHVALIISNGKLAHSGSEDGIHVDESVQISHNWIPGGYYTHVCLPSAFMNNPLFENN
jgi:cell wall-associated NlpC family hydrolase